MFCHLSALGGHHLGETVRRTLKILASNVVWAQFSLKGKEGQETFSGDDHLSCFTKYLKSHSSHRKRKSRTCDSVRVAHISKRL
ncbi:hypothetical protein AOXY_G22809 [Acipenser oxyrinchus oxyrinchus]|uniref:Uncharacterized protein n=1 Tax=Acipenser oxyrinchus oxyrinchus TaxID=40147 RepID=A0AAD8CVY1_ACIOX|nr:hypothetical protein AOXY_G22809 [Acipenser oxyrinchus oxyrinchus]